MDVARTGIRYAAGDTVKLGIVLHRRANLKEVCVIFAYTHYQTAAPLVAQGRPDMRPGRRWLDQQQPGRRDHAAPGSFYELVRASYETARDGYGT